MPYCSNCGQIISTDTKCCTYCGAENLAKKAKREVVSEGSVHKCPNCGETVGSFTATCPTCGYEFRDVEKTGSVKEFARQVKKIQGKKKKGGSDLKSIGINSKTDEQYIRLIRNFSIPNTKEDILEFLILATSNIDETAHEESAKELDKAISQAWEAKADQAYQKAQLACGDDPDFLQVEKAYLAKKKAISGSKKKDWVGLAVAVGLFVVPIAICLFMILRYESKAKELEQQLDATVVEIQQDIADGDYDSALIKANSLHFDPHLGQDNVEDWDEQREYLIELMEQKMEEEGK